MSNEYREQDAERVIVLVSFDGGDTWVPDTSGGGGGGGGGAVSSVDSRTGAVTLSDLYDALGAADSAQAAAEAASDPVGSAATAQAAAEAASDPVGSATTAQAAAEAASDPVGSAATAQAAAEAASDAAGSAATALASAKTYADTGDAATLASAQSYVNAHSTPLALTNGHVWIGDGSGLSHDRALSGDLTIDNAGVVTLKNTGTAATVGDATHVCVVTTDAQGRVTGMSSAAITGLAESAITGLVADLAAKAALASPALTGTPTAPTAAANTNNTQIATTAYADAIAALKANLASPAFTGHPTGVTESPLDGSTRLASTAYADAAATAAVAAAPAVPTATVLEYAGASAPAGFVLCDGSSYLRAGTMATLFGVIGTTFGSADGSHFNVPDRRDRNALGKSATHALGSTGGSTTHGHGHALTLPAHTHSNSLTLPSHVHGATALFGCLSMPAGAIVMNQISISPTWTSNQQGAATVTSPSTSGRGNGMKINGSTDAPSSFPAVGGTVDGVATGAGGAIGGTVSDNTSGPIDPYIAMNFIIKI